MGKLINNQSARKLIIAVAPYVYANKQLHLYFCVLVHYFVVLDIHLWKLYKNNYAAQAQWTLVNISKMKLRWIFTNVHFAFDE